MGFSFQPKLASLNGLVLYLDAANTKSYLGSGTTWTDLSSTAITGSLTNGPVFGTTNGGSINFDGADDYIGFNTTLGNDSSALTMESWVQLKRTSVTINSDHILSKGASSDYQYALRLQVLNGISGSVAAIAWQSGGASHILATTNSALNDSNWHHIVGVLVENTSATIYVDGVLHQTITTPSGSWNKTGAGQFRIGGRGDGVNYLSGSVAQVKLYNRALSSTEVLQNYNALCGRFGKTPAITDLDALAFVNAATISDDTQQRAINALVTDLKTTGLWSKMKAIYPFVGGTAASHKWNLKDPRDVDAAFRLTFSGGWTHSSTGALPNGTTGYADTFLVPATHLTENTTHLSYYSRTNTNTLSADIGSAGANPNRLEIVIRDNSWSISDHYNYNTNRVFITNLSDARGFFVSSRTTSTSHKYWRNNSQISSTNTGTSSGFSSLTNKTYLALLAIPGGGSYYGDKECAFATIGDGLTDTDAANLYTIVQKYQTTLGRQV